MFEGCVCPSGLQGADCTEDVDECARDDACAQNALCHNSYGNYACSCPLGYGGQNCEQIQQQIVVEDKRAVSNTTAILLCLFFAAIIIIVINLAFNLHTKYVKRRCERLQNQVDMAAGGAGGINGAAAEAATVEPTPSADGVNDAAQAEAVDCSPNKQQAWITQSCDATLATQEHANCGDGERSHYVPNTGIAVNSQDKSTKHKPCGPTSNAGGQASMNHDMKTKDAMLSNETMVTLGASGFSLDQPEWQNKANETIKLDANTLDLRAQTATKPIDPPNINNTTPGQGQIANNCVANVSRIPDMTSSADDQHTSRTRPIAHQCKAATTDVNDVITSS